MTDQNPLSGKHILLGVTGGIAAYKAVYLLRSLQQAGAEVRTVLTPAATHFVGTETFKALTRKNVPVEIFESGSSTSDDWTQHIQWAEWADLLVVAPCTANSLAKFVHGISDNMLSATVLAARSPILLCPTMDGGMYKAPATQQNLAKAREFGFHILEPDAGYLASGLEDKGRLPENETILSEIDQLLTETPSANTHQLLSGKKVVVTAGPTREHIDAVRYISNPSSGKMGVAMAEAARSMGADVTLIHGPLQVNEPDQMATVPITSTEELFDAVKQHHDADIIIMAAAVSDFSPTETTSGKIKKEDAEDTIKLKRTPDILQWLGENRRDGQYLIGFAMETDNLEANARKKRERKNVDAIIGNSLTVPGSGFASDTNTVHLFTKEESKEFSGLKTEVAREILDYLFSRN